VTPPRLKELQLSTLPTDQYHLYRLWRYPGGDWEPSPNVGRGRIDCPILPVEYFVLYLATTPLVALQETGLLTFQPDDHWLFHRSRATEYRLTEYSTEVSLVAATLDEPNAALLGLKGVDLVDGNAPYQQAALAIRRARSADVPALYWRSRHREASGLVVGIFHDQKANVGLSVVQTVKLTDHSVISHIARIKALIIG
jgi:hypothetical protein